EWRSSGSGGRGIHVVPAGRSEAECPQDVARDVARADFWKRHGFQTAGLRMRQQVRQAGAAVFDERAESQNLRSLIYIEDVGLDAFLGRDGEPLDLVFPRPQRFDRSLPAGLREAS